jgi:hypothetical protein
VDLETFTQVIKSFAGYSESAWSEIQEPYEVEGKDGDSSFAKRVITGLAAEQYFLSVQTKIPEFGGRIVQDTRLFGCGYDFRLDEALSEVFLAVEVKGLRGQTGGISMTPKEYKTAAQLRSRFFLFVVKNFRESPFHEVYQDPLSGRLSFERSERVTIQVSWLATV